MRFKFEKLTIWQMAMDFAEEMHLITAQFPNFETFGLSAQSRRAADSIALNIAEGSIDQSNPEQRKFISYSIRSLAESVTCLHKAKRRGYISSEEFDKRYTEAYNLMNMMIAFKRNIK